MSKQAYNFKESLGYLLGTASRALSLRLNKNLNENGGIVTFEQWVILVRLWEKDGLSQQEIANICGKDKTTITRLLDTLEKEEIIRREEDKNDRRNKLIFLTSAGKKLKNSLVPLALKTLDEAQEGINKKEMEICLKVLKQIKANLG